MNILKYACLCLLSGFLFQGSASAHGLTKTLIPLGYGQMPKGLELSLKIAVQENGVYKVRYEDLQQYGLVTSPIPGKEVALLGLPAGRLSPFNDASVPDGLAALPLWMEDNGDGIFGPGDYFLFYGQSPDILRYNPDSPEVPFVTGIHPYSEYQYYFICRDSTRHQPMATAREMSGPAEKTITSFPDFIRHEKEWVNLTKGSESWVGESFTEATPS